jgi:signal transduction histidine kinase
MHWEVKLFTFGLVICSVLSVTTAYYLLRKKDSPGVIYFAALGLISIIWQTGYIIELNSDTLSQKYLAIKVQYMLGIPFTPVLCYFAARHFTSAKKHPRLKEIILISIIPVISIIFVQTNEYHHFFYRSIGTKYYLSHLFFMKAPAPWYYVHICYSYFLVLFSGVLLFRNYLKSSGIIKKQSIYFLLVISLPFAASLLFVNRFFDGFLFDITPLCYTLAIVLIGYNLQKYGMPELLPEARKIVIASMSTGIIVLDPDNRIIEINPSAKKIFHKHQKLGMSFAELFRNTGININLESLQNRNIYELHISSNFYEVSVIEIPGQRSVNSGKIVTFHDITERKNNEKKLQELNSSKDRLFSVIAHDLKNPMYGMMGISELLYEDFDKLGNNEKAGFIKDINELSFNTHKMLESLLDWSMQQTGRINFFPAGFNICSLLRMNILSAEKQAGLKKIEISPNISGEINVFADKNMINTVIRNLLSNAIKFTGTNGKICVSAEENNNMAEVSVTDSGVGMSEENCSKLFRIDSGYKSTGTAGEKGTGLGLPLCKEFVEKNRGEIFVSSKPGEGSTFKFTVPLS